MDKFDYISFKLDFFKLNSLVKNGFLLSAFLLFTMLFQQTILAKTVLSTNPVLGDADLSLDLITDFYNGSTDTIVVVVLLNNEGPEDGENILIQIDLPSSLSIVSNFIQSGDFDETTSQWTLENIVPNTTFQMEILMVGDLTTPQTLEFYAEIISTDSDDLDSTPGNGVEIEDDIITTSIEIEGQSTAAQLISGFAWHDINGNGIQNPGEPGIEGIGIRLINEAESVIAETFTAIDGTYSFLDIPAGTYALIMVPTEEAVVLTTPNSGEDDTIDSDVLPQDNTSEFFELGVDQEIVIDAGFYIPVELSGVVWSDLNGDGIFDEIESGIENVLITFTSFNTPSLQTATDSLGMFAFTGLPPGDYSVSLPSLPESIGITTTDLYVLPTMSQTQITNIDFGLQLPINNPPCSDTLYTCVDPINANDSITYVPFEICLPNCDPDGNDVVITNITSTFNCIVSQTADLCFTHTPLPDLTLDSVFIEICDYSPFDTLCSTSLVVITIEEGCSGNSSIGDLVWTDANQNGLFDSDEMGLSNVLVTAVNQDGLEFTSMTDENGVYNINGLALGQYDVSTDISAVEGLLFTTPSIYEVILEETFSENTIDFGIFVAFTNAPVPCSDEISIFLSPLQTYEVCVPICDAAEFASISQITSTSGLEPTISQDTCLIYTANDAIYGDTLVVEICNTAGEDLCNTVTIFIQTVEETGPIANDDEFCLEADGTVTMDVLANDSHLTNLSFELSSILQGISGTASIVDGMLIYVADEDFSQSDEITYIICDEEGTCDEATVQILACPDIECEANAGTLITPDSLIYPSGATTEMYGVEGQNTDEGYNYFYILTTDINPADNIIYNIVAVNMTGVFNFSMNGLPDGVYQVHGMSFLGTQTELMDLNLTSGEAVVNAINLGNICGDLIVPGHSILVSDNQCLSVAGMFDLGPQPTSIPLSSVIIPPDITGTVLPDDFQLIYILTFNDTDNTIIDASTLGSFIINSYPEILPGDFLELWGLVIPDSLVSEIAGVSTIQNLQDDITNGLCGDLTNNSAVFQIQTSNFVCVADAGEVTFDGTAELEQGTPTDIPSVDEEADDLGYNYYYVLTYDSNPGDEILYDIVSVNQSGIFNTPDENLIAGTYQVHGLSFLGQIQDLMLGVSSIEDLLVEIELGFCADIIVPGYAFTVAPNLSCGADAGTLELPTTNLYEIGQTTVAPTPIDQNDAFAYYYILTTDEAPFDIISVNESGSFETDGFTEGVYQVWGVTIDGNLADVAAGVSVENLEALFALEDGCGDFTDNQYVFLVNEACEEYAVFCVPPLDASITPSIICPSFCGLENYEITEENINSAFGCGVHIFEDDLSCFEYTPLPGFGDIPDFIDTVVVIACDTINNLCDTITIQVPIGCHTPTAVNDQYVLSGSDTYELDVLINDSDLCEDSLFVSQTFISPLDTTDIAINQIGESIVLEPLNDFTGTLSFVYLATNDCGLASQAIVTITIEDDIPDVAVAVDDEATTLFETPVFIPALENDMGVGISIVEFNGPSNGTAVLEGSGLTYTPNDGFFGMDTLNYIIFDALGNSDAALIVITVTGNVNQPPIANPDEFMVVIGDSLTIDVIANDVDPEGGVLTVTDLIGPDTGIAIINEDGTITYFPDTTAGPGDYTFDYVLCDDGEPIECDTQTVLITVLPPQMNEAPIAVNDTVFIEPFGFIDIPVLSNDSDPNGDNLSVNPLVQLTGFGAFSLNPDGTVNYNNTNFFGFDVTDFVQYIVCDDGMPSLCDTAQILVFIIDPVEVIAQPDIAFVESGSFVNIPVLNNDSGTSISVTNNTNPQNGTVVFANNIAIYTPNNGFTGVDYFFYTICDNLGNCATTLVSVTVLDGILNHPPTAGNDQYEVLSGQTTVLTVLTNDSDPDGDEFIITEIFADPSLGDFTIGTDGISYTPAPGLTAGSYTFDYMICDINVDSILCDTATVLIALDSEFLNQAPTAVNDTIAVGTLSSIIFNVTDNDFDPNGDDLTVKFGTNPNNGIIDLQTDGLVLYTPNEGFSGVDYFMYILCDQADPALADTAFVTLTIDELIINGIDAEPDIVFTPINTATTIFVLDNDSGMGELSVKSFTEVNNGNLFFDDANNSFAYVPQSGFVGTDYFCYTMTDETEACDSTCVSITIFDSNENLPPVGANDVFVLADDMPVILDVLANDFDPENLPLTVTEILNGPQFGTVIIQVNGDLLYTPSSGFVGEDTFDYILCDAGTPALCDTATVLIAIGVDPSNNPPIAVDDNYILPANGSVDLDLLSNDSDPDNDNITMTFISEPESGELLIGQNGVGIFTPTDTTEMTYYLLYTLCDDGIPVLCDTAVVSITVTNDSIPPIPVDTIIVDAQPDLVQTSVNNQIVIDVTANDIGQGIMITNATTPSNGTIDVNALDGTITYLPNIDFVGQDYFFYTICDSLNNCDSTIVSVLVIDGDNLPPIANDDFAYLNDEPCIVIDIFANDFDPQNDTLILIDLSMPSFGGSALSNGDGTIVYCAPAGFVGTDLVEYIVCDGFLPGGLCDTATVSIFVNSTEEPNLPPVARDTCITVSNTDLTILQLADLVTEANGDNLTYEILSGGIVGTAGLNNFETGEAFYSPDGDTLTTDYFVYSVCDDGVPSRCGIGYVKLILSDTLSSNIIVIASNDTTTAVVGQEIPPINVLVNDIPADNPDITVTVINGTLFGTLTDLMDGLFTYIPDVVPAGDLPQDFFTYELCLNGVCDTAVVVIEILACEIEVRTGFSPNEDLINDYFDIPGLNDCFGDNNPIIKIYNRWGNIVYERAGYTGAPDGSSWNGTYENGAEVPDGTYYWILDLGTGEDDSIMSGYVEVLR